MAASLPGKVEPYPKVTSAISQKRSSRFSGGFSIEMGRDNKKETLGWHTLDAEREGAVKALVFGRSSRPRNALALGSDSNVLVYEIAYVRWISIRSQSSLPWHIALCCSLYQ